MEWESSRNKEFRYIGRDGPSQRFINYQLVKARQRSTETRCVFHHVHEVWYRNMRDSFRYVAFFFEKGPLHSTYSNLLSFLSFMKKKHLIHQSSPSKDWKARSTALCSISGISIHHLAAEWVSGLTRLVSCPIVLWASPVILYFHQDASFDAVEPTSNSFDIVVTLTIMYVRSLGCHGECFGLVCHIVRINEIM